ncbi:hypothetical protein [Blastomonas aquatica]|nr:hypothetical protein [Blastomonas aquatica]
MLSLDEEASRATQMLSGRALSHVRRFKATEVLLEFEDGTRLYIDSASTLELSITTNAKPDGSCPSDD